MKVGVFANNWLGWRVLQEMCERPAFAGDVVAIFYDETGKEHVGIRRLAEEMKADLFAWKNNETTATICEDRGVEIGLSVAWRHIFKPPLLADPPHTRPTSQATFPIYNIHTGYLPYGRGAMPNVWAIAWGHPAGVAIHLVDAGVDSGPIVSRAEVPVDETDTGFTLQQKLLDRALELFKKEWPNILAGNSHATPQSEYPVPHRGVLPMPTYRMSDVNQFDCIDEWHGKRRGRTLIDYIRARTYSGYNGAYFLDKNGKKVFMRLELYREEGG